MQGFFQLETPDDLLAKLERDFARMNRAPNDPDPAYDFFVTAEHMLDWLYPGNAGRKSREEQRDRHALLQLVSHIATGAKHMVPEAKRHKSVGISKDPRTHILTLRWPSIRMPTRVGRLGSPR